MVLKKMNAISMEPEAKSDGYSTSSVYRSIHSLTIRCALGVTSAITIALAHSPVLAQSPRSLWKSGAEYASSNDITKAIDQFSKALELNPGFVNALSDRSLAYLRLNQLQKALDDISQAISLDQSRYVSYARRGLVYSAMESYDMAIADFTRAIQMIPNTGNPGHIAEAYHRRGLAKRQLMDLRGAVSDYDKALEYAPNTAQIYLDRSFAKILLRDKKGMCSDLSAAARFGYSKAVDLLNNPSYGRPCY